MTSPIRTIRGLTSPKISIDVKINNPKTVYTTFDKIEGQVSISSRADFTFDSIRIELVGSCKTFVDRLYGRSECSRDFLNLAQPDLRALYPNDQVLLANEMCHIPFEFAVPSQLLPQACQHSVKAEAIREAHLQLPPSLSGNGTRPDGTDDLSPEMAVIEYKIVATVVKHARGPIAEPLGPGTYSNSVPICVIPKTDIPLPFVSDDSIPGFCPFRAEKALRKTFLRGQLGTVSMESTRPSPIQLHIADGQLCYTTSMIALDLRYDPVNNTHELPSLGALTCKIQAQTFFGCTLERAIPVKSTTLGDATGTKGLYSESVNLSSRCMAGAVWQKHDRRDSHISEISQSSSFASTNSATSARLGDSKSDVFYTTRLLVPITLPTEKCFVATFYSCFIARNYSLKIDLSIGTNKMVRDSIALKIPIQITSPGGETGPPPEYLDVDKSAPQFFDFE